MSLFPPMTSKKNSIRNCYIITNFNFIIAHVIKIATHADKCIPTYLIPTPTVTLYSQVRKWNGWNHYYREPLPNRFGKNSKYGIITIIGGGRILMCFSPHPRNKGFFLFHHYILHKRKLQQSSQRAPAIRHMKNNKTYQ